MFNKHTILRGLSFCALLLLMSLLAGCHLPSDEPCSESELTLVEDTAPHDKLVNTLTPMLTWRYPDPSCYPGLYHIEIYDEDIIGGTYDHSVVDPRPIHVGQSVDPRYSVPASAGLQPGKTYAWMVSARTAEDRGRGGSVIDWFTTGPLCDAGTSLVAPILTYPPDNAEMYFPDSIKLHWDNQMSTCWPGGDITLQISTRSNFSVPVWFGAVRYKEYIWIQDTVPPFNVNCRRYYWRVRADPAGGGEGPYSEARSFVVRLTEAMCPLDLGMVITRIPPEGIGIPPAGVLKQPSNCRSGPSMDYPALDILAQGLSLPVTGRNQDGSWWQVLDSNLQLNCWLAAGVIDLSGDTSAVPVVQVAPLPAAVPSDTPLYNCAQHNEKNCEGPSHPCKWEGGACVNK